MVQKIVVHLVDDIDGAPAQETVTFALDGVSYEIDLSDEHAAQLRGSVEGWKSSARRLAGRTSSKTGPRDRAGTSGVDASEIRTWANTNGFTVSERGRIPQEVRAAYANAH